MGAPVDGAAKEEQMKCGRDELRSVNVTEVPVGHLSTGSMALSGAL